MPIEKIAIVGSSGAYGRSVIRLMRRRYPAAAILGLDLQPAETDLPDRYLHCDIVRDDVAGALARFAPDTVIHLAFVVNPIHNERRMREINVEGTNRVFDAARRCGAKRVLVSSSATAYGAWPDNPVPMEETAPIRARPEYRYAADKAEIETIIADFAAAEPGIAVSWTRPAIFYGPDVSNYLTRFIINAKVIALAGGSNTPMQFVHIDDVAAATLAILEADARGPFNVAPQDWVTPRLIGQLTGRPCLPIPFALCKGWSSVWWSLRLPWFKFPSGLWYFIRYPWVVTPKRLTEELGFRFLHTSRQTLEMLLASRDLLIDSRPDRPSGEPVTQTAEAIPSRASAGSRRVGR